MANTRRRRWWVVVPCGLGLLVTVVAAVYSEFRVVSYREDTGGLANRFLLNGSSVLVMYRPGPDRVVLTGLELFEPGWSVRRTAGPTVYPRNWWPSYHHNVGGVGEFYLAVMPLWAPVVVFGAGLWWGWGRPVRAEVCARCGYDVCGVTAVCPECGTSVACANSSSARAKSAL